MDIAWLGCGPRMGYHEGLMIFAGAPNTTTGREILPATISAPLRRRNPPKESRVKIYRSHGARPRWFVAFPTPDGRKVRAFTHEAQAEQFAKKQSERVEAGQEYYLSAAERQELLECRRMLDGYPLLAAVKEWNYARVMAPGASPRELVNHWKKHHADIVAKPIPAMLPEFLERKRQDGLSARWLADLEDRLGRFAGAHDCALGDLCARDIDDWLRGLDISPRSRKNYRTAISTLANWAKGRGYLSAAWDETGKIDIGRSQPGQVHILSPDQLRALLGQASAQIIPFIALGAFAGVRSAEIRRLTWHDVGPDYITVAAGKAKTAARRLVPILPTLRIWLDNAHPKRLVDGYYQERAVLRVAARACITWHANVLRHSYCSYRLAAIQDVAQVALEAGNSPAMIFSHYRELVTPAQAEAWFLVLPKRYHPLPQK